MYGFLKAFLVLMKLLSLSQFYAPKKYETACAFVLLMHGDYVRVLIVPGVSSVLL